MNHHDQKLGSEIVVLGLGYATSLLVVIGWIATLVL